MYNMHMCNVFTCICTTCTSEREMCMCSHAYAPLDTSERDVHVFIPCVASFIWKCGMLLNSECVCVFHKEIERIR